MPLSDDIAELKVVKSVSLVFSSGMKFDPGTAGAVAVATVVLTEFWKAAAGKTVERVWSQVFERLIDRLPKNGQVEMVY